MATKSFNARRAGLIGIAVLASALGWICLAFVPPAFEIERQSVQLLGVVLLLVGTGYQLLAMALILAALERFQWFDSRRLAACLSAAGFLAALPIALAFQLADQPFLVAAICFALAWAPALTYQLRAH